MDELGRPVPALGIRRIEDGQRRVDVDDLAAFAVALGVSPTTLLIPDVDEGDAIVSVTGSSSDVSARALWDWLVVAAPLSDAISFLGFGSRAWPSWIREQIEDRLSSGETMTLPEMRQMVGDLHVPRTGDYDGHD